MFRRVYPMPAPRIWISLLSILLGLLVQPAAVSAAAEDFVPRPGLRIVATGILGSDGTRFETTLVSAVLEGESWVTEAETELIYTEGRSAPQPVPEKRTVWRYVGRDAGVEKEPRISTRGYAPFLWLAGTTTVGTQWKASWGNRREIMQNDVTVDTPAGRFEGCLMVEYDVYAGGTGIERHYIAPGVGLVKVLSFKTPSAARGQVWYEVQSIGTIPVEEAQRIILQMPGM